MNGRGPKNEIRGHEVDQLARLVIAANTRELSNLMKGVGINHGVYPLADRQFTKVVLAGHLLFAAHRFSQCAALVEFLEFFIPAHKLDSAFGHSRIPSQTGVFNDIRAIIWAH
jgi:hypothetical protein